MQVRFRLNWQSACFDGGESRKKKAASKTKYTCPTCGANAWAKPEPRLICGTCYEEDDQEITSITSEAAPDEQLKALRKPTMNKGSGRARTLCSWTVIPIVGCTVLTTSVTLSHIRTADLTLGKIRRNIERVSYWSLPCTNCVVTGVR
jgi:ribosomal protein S27AE